MIWLWALDWIRSQITDRVLYGENEYWNVIVPRKKNRINFHTFSICSLNLSLYSIFRVFISQAQCQDSQCHCIEDSPPPHSALSQQSCPIDGGNGNGGPGSIINDEYSRRPSIDRLDSPQVILPIPHRRMDEFEFFFLLPINSLYFSTNHSTTTQYQI